MRDAREFSARTGESMRWFIFTLATVFPWIALFILGPWLTMISACVGVAFWLWWVYPPIGLNRRPATWLLTVGLIIASAITLLLAADQLQHPTSQPHSLAIGTSQ